MNVDTVNAFTRQPIDAAYINTLVDFIIVCRKFDVKIDTVSHYMHGWLVTFEGFEGDAICHNGSYGSPCWGGMYHPEVERNDWNNYSGRWETIGFPWDGEDVSVHSGNALAHMIAALRDGQNWEEYEDC